MYLVIHQQLMEPVSGYTGVWRPEPILARAGLHCPQTKSTAAVHWALSILDASSTPSLQQPWVGGATYTWEHWRSEATRNQPQLSLLASSLSLCTDCLPRANPVTHSTPPHSHNTWEVTPVISPTSQTRNLRLSEVTPLVQVIQLAPGRERGFPGLPGLEPSSAHHPESLSTHWVSILHLRSRHRCAYSILQMRQLRPGANTRPKVTASHSAPSAVFLGQEKTPFTRFQHSP